MKLKNTANIFFSNYLFIHLLLQYLLLFEILVYNRGCCQQIKLDKNAIILDFICKTQINRKQMQINAKDYLYVFN
jgi:hypothetical protein